jgi:ElaB/YqjD/DUF883 family membrane-anchored ribosome-binding protein
MADDSHSHDSLPSQIQQVAGDLKAAASAMASEYGTAAAAKAAELRAAAAAKADELRAAANVKAGEFRSAASGAADELRGKAEHAWGDAKVHARTYQEDGVAYIRENPTRALLIALGAGFVLGLMVRK